MTSSMRTSVLRVVAEDRADRLGDFARRKNSKRHLIEQRLKDVVVLAVDDSDVDGQLAESFAA